MLPHLALSCLLPRRLPFKALLLKQRIHLPTYRCPRCEGSARCWQASNIKPLKKRFAKRNAQVSFTFNSADVGGLDVDFVQQNVYNDPQTAWRRLELLDSLSSEQDPAAELAQDEQFYSSGVAAGVAAVTPRNQWL